METFRFPSAIDAFPLVAYRWPAERPRGIVVIAHGAAEHSLRYTRFAAALNAAGLDAWALDHRGHGQSPGPEGLGDFGEGGWDALVADIGQLIDTARAAVPGIPLVLFGHSMGSFAAQQLALTRSDAFDALVLSGSTSREAPKEGDPPPRFAPNEPFEPARTPYDWLSRDDAEVDKYIADPLCGFESRRSQRSGRADPTLLATPEALVRIRPDLAVLLVAGDKDPINRNLEGLHLLERRWREAGIRRMDRLYYEGGRHEMLNETNREQVTGDVIGWIREMVL